MPLCEALPVQEFIYIWPLFRALLPVQETNDPYPVLGHDVLRFFAFFSRGRRQGALALKFKNFKIIRAYSSTYLFDFHFWDQSHFRFLRFLWWKRALLETNSSHGLSVPRHAQHLPALDASRWSLLMWWTWKPTTVGRVVSNWLVGAGKPHAPNIEVETSWNLWKKSGHKYV